MDPRRPTDRPNQNLQTFRGSPFRNAATLSNSIFARRKENVPLPRMNPGISLILLDEVMAMDYSAYHEFPFPSDLNEEDARLRDFFLGLSDGEQLRLLNGSLSYGEFRGRVAKRRAGG